MINFDGVTNEYIKEHNPSSLQILNFQCRILLIAGSGSGKTNTLLTLISHQAYIDEIHLHARDPCEAEYKFLINMRKVVGLFYL